MPLHKTYKFLSVVLLALSSFSVNAQELNCKVQIISPTLQTSAADKQVFVELTSALREFMNNTRWGTENFKVEERIEMNILINLSEQPSADEFGGSIQVTTTRPVHNTNYKSTVFNWIDNDFKFKYQRGAAIQFSIDRHRDNLSSVMAFYAYIALGYDYDSYGLEGGTKYLVKAQQVASNAQGVAEPGWRAAEGQRNRYWLIENALQQLFQPLRQVYYKYHREGFDVLFSNINSGTNAVLECLDLIQKVSKSRPGSFNVQLFFSTKVDELVNLFQGASPETKLKAYNLLKSLDPSNLNKYNKINKQ
jgi:Domain of unknown function (DUF4835)